jgi:addiction module HigA family antidote
MQKTNVIHPGEILREEFMAPKNISAKELAAAMKVPTTRIEYILSEKRGISIDTALRLSEYFGNTSQFWLNLQINYDNRKSEEEEEKQPIS